MRFASHGPASALALAHPSDTKPPQTSINGSRFPRFPVPHQRL